MRTILLVPGLVLGAIGCGFHSPSEGNVDGMPDAAPTDASSVDAGPCVPWPAVNIDPCNVGLGNPAPVMMAAGGYTLDTDDGTLTDLIGKVTLPGALVAQTKSGPLVRVVNATSLTIDALSMVTVVGSHPILFVVHGDATISGTIDASARMDGSGTRTAGPGGNDASQCTSATGADGKKAGGSSGGGGGGGGAYGGDGGNGGDGEGPGHGGKGNKGAKVGDPMLEPLRGGCRGGSGGDDSDMSANDGGLPGDGGGAIEITALGQITITGMIAAGGTGGSANGLVRAGGGGGGSGGAIVIDGDKVLVTADGKLCANGGGGGEGGQDAAGSRPGAAATCTTTRAAGGQMQADGGNGGDGGVGGSDNGTDGMNGANNAAGGGGGGGVGRIRVHGRTQRMITGALVTPMPSM